MFPGFDFLVSGKPQFRWPAFSGVCLGCTGAGRDSVGVGAISADVLAGFEVEVGRLAACK